MRKINQTQQWQALSVHAAEIAKMTMREMFDQDASRFQRFAAQGAGIFVDFSKNRMSDETLALLCDLARAADVEGWRARMFSGEAINFTENRAVLHTALRNSSDRPVLVDGRDVMGDVHDVLARMRAFSEQVRSGRWRGMAGDTISDVVNIGIGGSDLGPRMAVRALAPYVGDGPNVHFVSNVDPADLAGVLSGLDAARTLFVVCSKTFTTQETMANADAARKWFLQNGGNADAVAKHFVAVSTNASLTADFGIAPENVFGFWDWVGGRYSMWSAVGLSIMLAVGADNFDEILAGADDMDRHFCEAPLEENLPVILAMLGVWYINFFAARTHAVIPYDASLDFFPAYLQQLDMESNGKAVDRQGDLVAYHTAPVIWGRPGTDSQHSFFQELHQGPDPVPVDFIVCAQSQTGDAHMHDMLVANCFAQSEALMRGLNEDEARAQLQADGVSAETLSTLLPHKIFSGNRPSNTLMLDRLTPRALGALVALYEHRTFVQGVVWNLNSFDQWGVELGKKLAGRVLADFSSPDEATAHDGSTHGLISRYLRTR